MGPQQRAIERLFDQIDFRIAESESLDRAILRARRRHGRHADEPYLEAYTVHLDEKTIRWVTNYPPYTTNRRTSDQVGGSSINSKLYCFWGSGFSTRVEWARENGLYPDPDE